MLLRWFLLLALLSGCSLAPVISLPTETVPGESLGWETIAPGMEQRLYTTETNLPLLQTVRVDPAQVIFRAVYRPGSPLTLDEWQEALPDAQVIINANFFTPENTVLGTLISDGLVYGQPYRDRGGAFVIENGLPRIVSNLREPYQGQAWQQAVQAFPLLVDDGTAAYTNVNDRQIARRTVIAQDAQGRILLMVTPGLGISLPALSSVLAELDAEIVMALNLDGGGSTMMRVAPSGYRLLSFDPVPAVLAVYGSG